MSYTRYTVEDADGNDCGLVWEQSEYRDARTYALKISGKVIAQEYVWEDSELIDDFTEQEDTDEGGS